LVSGRPSASFGGMKRFVQVYVFDTLADWEPGHAIAELNSGRFLKPEARIPVRTVGRTNDPVKTMGGLRLLPDTTLDQVTPDNTAVLLLSGGTTWFEPVHAPVVEKARALLAGGVLVAAICGATMRLARDGLLDSRAHTSDNLDALKATCPSYRGEAFFKQAPAVTDGNLITASGLAPLDFAYHILKKLEVMTAEALQAWFKLYQTRQPEFFFALMQAVQPAG
jgi:putative intracellular protease/amidase